MAFLDELALLDSLKHETGWLEKGRWSKMTHATAAMSDAAGGATPPGFSTLGGSFYNANEPTAATPAQMAVSIQRSLGSDIAERYFSLWSCYTDSTNSGYRAKFLHTTASEIVVTIYKVESGTEKELGKSVAFTPEGGDIFALVRASSGGIAAWRKPKGTGTWVELLGATDTGTKFTAGQIGFDGSGSDPTFTEFRFGVGVGNLTPLVPKNISSGSTKPIGVVVSPDGANLYACNFGSGIKAVSQFLRNAETGQITALSPATVEAELRPSGVCVSPDGKHVYVSCFENGKVAQFSRGAEGKLTALSPLIVASGGGAHGICISPDGKHVYTSNFEAGTISQYARNAETGLLTALSPATVTAGIHANGVCISADGKNVYCANRGASTISQFSRNESTGLLTALSPATVATGTEPYNVSVTPDGKHAYVGCSGSAAVYQFSRDSTGHLAALSPTNIAAGTSTHRLVISWDGINVYAANSGNTSVSEYSRNSATGLLTALSPASISTQLSPYDIALSPDGKFGYAPNEESSTISQFSRQVQLPTVEAVSEQHTVEKATASLQINATGATSYSATGLPTGLSINAATGLISGTVSTGSHGTFHPKVAATNETGSAETTWTWVISEASTINSPGNQQWQTGINQSLRLTGTGISSINVSGLPLGVTALRLSTTTVEIFGSPIAPGSFSVTVEVIGSESQKSSMTFMLAVIALVIWAPMTRSTATDEFPLHLTIGTEDCTFLLSESFTFANSDPGGYESASFPIPRDLPWVKRGMNVLLTSGTAVAWEGRVKEIQRSLGEKTLIQCEGYVNRLKEQTIREIYVDRDMSKWRSTNTDSQIKRINESITPNPIELLPAPETGKTAVATGFTGAWSTTVPICEGVYDAKGIPIGSIHYTRVISGGINTEDTGWQFSILASTKEFSKEGAINALQWFGQPGGLPAEESGVLTVTLTTCIYGMVALEYVTKPAGATDVVYRTYWLNLAIYGRHGLTKRGTEPGGFYTSDIVTHALSRAEGIQAGYIPQQIAFVVPQAVYLTYVPIEQVVADMAKLIGCHWGVWHSIEGLMGGTPRLDFRPYPETPTAYAYRAECESLDIREDLENQYNVAQVSFTEAAGIERTVEVSVDNPALDAAEISKRVLTLNMGTATTASAEAYGKLSLEVLQLQARVTGQATIKEVIHRIGGEAVPPWLLKSGIDRLRVPDMPCSDVWGQHNDLPISRVECTGSADGISVSVEFGSGRNLLEAMTSELEAATSIAVA